MDVKQIGETVKREQALVERVFEHMGKVIIGQEQLVRTLVVGLLADGHVLLEGLPGLAKTRSVYALAKLMDASFQRIQFTPDLLPADVVGTLIYVDGEFRTHKGPVFANVVLADEINRAPAKVQSALLEAMQERCVTLGNTTHDLPDPFMVLATQNPIEQEGTYPLPEAQVDRFLLKVRIGYPSRDEERLILDLVDDGAHKLPELTPALTLADLLRIRSLVQDLYMDERIKGYIVDLVQATRTPGDYGIDLEGLIAYGASPRATIALALCSRAAAFLAGRPYVTPQDIKDVAMPVLRHRVMLTYEAEAQDLNQDAVVQRVLDGVKVP